METPEEYIHALPKPPRVPPRRTKVRYKPVLAACLSERSIYYPGSGTDVGPLDLFGQRSFASTIVYSDYSIESGGVDQMFEGIGNWRIEKQRDFSPEDFGARDWSDFWPAMEASRSFANPSTAFCKYHVLADATNSNRIDFLVLATEGIQTYSRLARLGFAPFVVVVQDHGFGGNWAKFGGESLLYQAARRNLPELIYVADNSEPWPGYEQVSAYGSPEGSGPHCRALFRLTHSRQA